MNESLQISDYEAASEAVRRRVGALRFLRWLKRGHWIAAAAALFIVLALRRFGEWREGEWAFVLAILVLWAVIGFILSRVGRPRVMESLLLLDRKGGWKDRFSSAWAFLSGGEMNEAQTLHVKKSGGVLPEALSNLPGVLPFPSLRWIWVAPLIALLFSLSPFGRLPIDSADVKLSDGMKEVAALEADELKKEAARFEDLNALTEEEKAEFEKLRAEVDSVAEDLAESDDLTAGEMLEALESRARAAERLAEKLGLTDDGWASEEMLTEMRSHPDTADLGLAIKDKSASGAADEAMTLQGILNGDDIQIETQERLTRVMESIMTAATDEDKTKPVGERVGNASIKLLNAQTKTAAREFEELAKYFRLIDSREEAQEKLEQMASSLREAGSEISGSDLDRMEQIADESSSGEAGQQGGGGGLQSLDSDPVSNDIKKMTAPHMAQSGQSPEAGNPSPGQQKPGEQSGEGSKQVPVPGQAPGEGDETSESNPNSQQAFGAPIPGEAPPQGQSGSGMQMSENARDGKGRGGMLSAPVPGMDAKAPTPGQGVTASQAGMSQAGQGGNEAGSGTAEMIDDQSEATKAARDSEVVAQINDNGDSTFRAVDGKVRNESVERTRQEIVTDYLAAEEQALDGQTLPLSRRKHVLRYFSAIRKQFEEADPAE
ncbi:MAG: hypothetical protein P1U86_11730 [Verrucomicrobiales bacterium]|nr:hypothetical protein [Verrucomicrobiales bacterium]